MKLGTRISILLCFVSFLTILLLTVLMGFRYHLTRQTLVNERLGVIMSNISANMESSIRMGLDIRNIKNIGEVLAQSKNIDNIIKNIYVFNIENDSLVQIHSTTPEIYDQIGLKELKMRINGAKNTSWNTTTKEKLNIVGLTIRDSANLDRAAIAIVYDPEIVRKNEMKEIKLLYMRMIVGSIIAGILAFLVGYSSTKELAINIHHLDKIVKDWHENPQAATDLSGITDPTLKMLLRESSNNIQDINKQSSKIDSLITESKKIKTKQENEA